MAHFTALRDTFSKNQAISVKLGSDPLQFCPRLLVLTPIVTMQKNFDISQAVQDLWADEYLGKFGENVKKFLNSIFVIHYLETPSLFQGFFC